jgi:hypothetical protein
VSQPIGLILDSNFSFNFYRINKIKSGFNKAHDHIKEFEGVVGEPITGVPSDFGEEEMDEISLAITKKADI